MPTDEPVISHGFSKALLAGGLVHLGATRLGVLLVRAEHLARRRLETALTATFDAVIAVTVMGSYPDFLGGALAPGVLVYLGATHRLPGPGAAPPEAAPVLLPYRGEVVVEALRLFFTDARPPARWKRNDTPPPRGQRAERERRTTG